ncbi:MAG TPA: glycerate kinase [Telluria sp.]
MPANPRALLLDLFRCAVAAVDPAVCILPFLPPAPEGRLIVIGAGKAAARMAEAVERHYAGKLEGLVVTRYGHGAATRHIEVIEAAHPVPDDAGARAATRMLALVHGLNADDLVLCLVSGGGSALLALPAPGITMEDKRAITRALLASGAPIAEMNRVRRHLSAIKGGRLALACHPARVVTLVVSDVPGDDPAVVASGPTVPDGSSGRDALAVLEQYRIVVPDRVRALLSDPANDAPLPGDPRLARNEVHVVGSAQQALDAAAALAQARGYAALVLSDCIEGEARAVAQDHAAMVRRVLSGAEQLVPPCVILSGGETTVTVRGEGRGGRNAEFLLALAIALDGEARVHALACDTDGIDGTEDNAGALIDPGTLARCPLDARTLLERNDAYRYFAALGDLVVTGPTRTNVNDFRAILIES